MVGRAGIARANWALDLTARQQCLTLPSSPRQSCKAFPKGERLERSDSPERRPRLPPSFARRRPTRRLEGWPAIQRSSRAPSLAGGAFWEDARLGSGPTAPVAHATPQVSNQGSIPGTGPGVVSGEPGCGTWVHLGLRGQPERHWRVLSSPAFRDPPLKVACRSARARLGPSSIQARTLQSGPRGDSGQRVKRR
jgi:hypothetical protein